MRLILRTAAVHTMDAREPRAEAILVEHGRVLALGSDADARGWARPGDRVLDCRDAVALPGLVDHHFHLRGYALQLQRVDLNGVRSPAEAAARAAQAAARLGPQEWVVGRGWDRNRFDEPRWPEPAELVAALGDRPALLGSVDGHAAWATPAAFRAAGMDPGSGIVFEKDVDRLRAAVPPPSRAQLAGAMRHALHRLAALGLTAVWTMDGRLDLEAALAAQAAGPLPLRVFAHLADTELEHAPALGLVPGVGAGRLRLAGVKIYADGALGTQTAWMLEPYEGTAGHGIAVTPPEALQPLVARACAAGLPPCVHAIGDAAVRAVLDAVAAVPAATRAALPFAPRVEHAQCIHPDDVPRFAALGVAASVQPRHIPLDVPVAERWWGARAGERAYPFRRLVQAGAALYLGTDAPVVPPDPGPNWRAAVARLPDPADGAAAGPWHGAQALTIAETVAASVAGPLQPGAPADISVVRPDPFRSPAAELDRLEAVCTVTGGTVTAVAA